MSRTITEGGSGGGGGTITGSGTVNTVAKFTGATAIGDSSITDDGSVVATAEPVQINGASGAMLNAKARAAISGINFAGSGLNDLTPSVSSPTGTTDSYEVEITNAGTPDQFKWRKGSGGWSSDVNIVAGAIALSDGVSVTFGATTGHTSGDAWTISVTVDDPFQLKTGANAVVGKILNDGTVALGKVTSYEVGKAQIAIGNSATVSGSGSVCIGEQSVVSADGGIANGVGASASANSAIAIGTSSNASSEYAVAIGWGAAGSGSNSVSIGKSATTNANANSTAIGNSAYANGANAQCVGALSVSTGVNATCFGAGSTADAYSVVVGSGCTGGKGSVSIGSATTASGTASISIGANIANSKDDAVAIGASAVVEMNGQLRIPALSATPYSQTTPFKTYPIGQLNAALINTITSQELNTAFATGAVSVGSDLTTCGVMSASAASGTLTFECGNAGLPAGIQVNDTVEFSNFVELAALNGLTLTVTAVANGSPTSFECSTALADFTVLYESSTTATANDTTTVASVVNTATTPYITVQQVGDNVVFITDQVLDYNAEQMVALSGFLTYGLADGSYSIATVTGSSQFEINAPGAANALARWVQSQATLTAGEILIPIPVSAPGYLGQITGVIVTSDASGNVNATVDVGVVGALTRYFTGVAIAGSLKYTHKTNTTDNVDMMNGSLSEVPAISITNNSGSGMIRVKVVTALTVMAPVS